MPLPTVTVRTCVIEIWSQKTFLLRTGRKTRSNLSISVRHRYSAVRKRCNLSWERLITSHLRSSLGTTTRNAMYGASVSYFSYCFQDNHHSAVAMMKRLWRKSKRANIHFWVSVWPLVICQKFLRRFALYTIEYISPESRKSRGLRVFFFKEN